MQFSLGGRNCLITGGGTGIGRGIALELAAAGGRIAVVGRREEALAETVGRIESAGGHGVFRPADVTDAAQVQTAVADLASELGSIDVLVNNAGIGGPNKCAADGPDRWDAIVRTNLDGVYFCSREALAHMPDGGRIIVISSVLGKFGVPGYTAYCASKHGVIGFTKALALEVASRGITVNAICPGWVETQMARDGMELMAEQMGTSYDAAREQALGMVPLGRIMQPEEIGATCVYLASEAGAAITAQAISVCGGQVMNG